MPSKFPCRKIVSISFVVNNILGLSSLKPLLILLLSCPIIISLRFPDLHKPCAVAYNSVRSACYLNHLNLPIFSSHIHPGVSLSEYQWTHRSTTAAHIIIIKWLRGDGRKRPLWAHILRERALGYTHAWKMTEKLKYTDSEPAADCSHFVVIVVVIGTVHQVALTYTAHFAGVRVTVDGTGYMTHMNVDLVCSFVDKSIGQKCRTDRTFYTTHGGPQWHHRSLPDRRQSLL